MKKQSIQSISIVLGLVLLSSCANRSAYKKPEVVLPEQWQAGASSANVDEKQFQQWWQKFNDPVLSQLIHKATAQNIDLKIAQAQLREARALANIVSGNQGPEVSASASAKRTKGSSSSRTVYDAGFDASWEVDIFGAQRREVEAATADVDASEEALHNVRVSVVAEVARNYVALRVDEYRLFVAQSNVNVLEETYQLAQWKYQAGLISALDESLAKTQLEQVKANVPLIESSLVTVRNSLAVLLGKLPGELTALLNQSVLVGKSSAEYIPSMDGEMMLGIPADVIRQRPDVRNSERKLAAQTARLSAAQAARYPRLNLTGSIGVEALKLGRLGNSDASYSLMAGITAPIFDAGRIRSNIERQDALLEQSRLQYQSSILASLADVENALSLLANNQQRKNNLLKAADSAKNSLDLTRYQYQSGLIDFQTLLENQRNLLGLQDQLAGAIGDYSLSQIALYKALGGGWQSAKERKNKAAL